MVNKLSSDDLYHIMVTNFVGRGYIEASIYEVKTKKTKIFTIRGVNHQGVYGHMLSLTDQQCADFLKGVK